LPIDKLKVQLMGGHVAGTDKQPSPEEAARVDAHSRDVMRFLGTRGANRPCEACGANQWAIERDIGIVKAELPNLANKSDLYKAINEQTWKVVGMCALLVTVAFWGARNLG
jgi:hypothetical protein